MNYLLTHVSEETRSHALLASQGLAPPLLARFRNGLLYRFLRGQVASPQDLTQPNVWRGVARRLAEWHAVLPVSDTTTNPVIADHVDGEPDPLDNVDGHIKSVDAVSDDITPLKLRQSGPNLWSVTQKWILALPVTTEKERERRRFLHKEFERIVAEMDDGTGLGEGGVRKTASTRSDDHY